MAIFSRIRDIVHSNINAMLDKAEDPEKLIRLMISEMEDSLVEIKVACANAIATQKRIAREKAIAQRHADDWGAKAKMAVEKNREDLAREALLEKRSFQERLDALDEELANFTEIVDEYKKDIGELERKLIDVRERRRVLIQRHIRARQRKAAREAIRKVETHDVFSRIEAFENRIDRLEAEAELADYGRKSPLIEEFNMLERDEEIEKELESLKQEAQHHEKPASSDAGGN